MSGPKDEWIWEEPFEAGDCPDALELAGYIDASLAPELRSRVERHIAGCASCLRVVSDGRDLIASVRPTLAAGDIREGAKSLVGQETRRSSRLGVWVAAAAAGVMLTIGGAVWLVGSNSTSDVWEPGFVLVVDDRSGAAGPDTPMFVASSTNYWMPDDPSQRLSQRSDGRWTIELPQWMLEDRMEFKLTLGSWETVEVSADSTKIENRVLPATVVSGDELPVIEVVVERFRDADVPGASRYVVVPRGADPRKRNQREGAQAGRAD